MRNRTLIGILGVALLSFAGLTLQGTTVPKMDLKTLVDGSDRILQGKVEAIETQMDRTLNLPFTIVRVHVDDPICQRPAARVRCSAGASDRRQTVFLKHLGGQMMGPNGRPTTVQADGIPQFNVGDNVIVFLRELAGGNFQVVGLNQGKYEVINEIAISSISGMDLVDPKTGRALPSIYTENAPVDALKAKIRELTK